MVFWLLQVFRIYIEYLSVYIWGHTHTHTGDFLKFAQDVIQECVYRIGRFDTTQGAEICNK